MNQRHDIYRDVNDLNQIPSQGWYEKETTCKILNKFEECVLKARTENILYFPCEQKNYIVIEKKEIANGIYLGNAIETPKNGFIKLAIINARENDFILENSIVNACINSLSDYDIITESYSPTEELKRHETIEKLIDLSHCNADEREKVLMICLKYHKVFHLKGDKFSSTNATTHRIPLLPDTIPINTKPILPLNSHK